MASALDLLLVYPNNRARAYGSLADQIAAITPPVGLGLIAAYVRKQGFSVQLLDADAENLTAIATADEIVRRKPLLMLMATDQLNSGDVTKMAAASDCMKAHHARGSGILTVMEGVSPSAYPERMLREENADFAIQGEAYLPLVELLTELKAGRRYPSKPIEGIWWRAEDGSVVESRRPALWKVPDELPMVPWDLLPMSKYRAHHWHCFDRLNARQPYAAIWTNLGCPYDCSFCSVNIVFGKPNYRARTAENVVEEIDLLVNKYKISNLRIVDNIFTVQPDLVEKLCDLIIARGYDLNMWAYARVETVKDLNLAKKMRKAGVRWLAYGIEAADAGVRKGVSKGSAGNVIDRAIEITKEADINIVGNFIFGLPDDTHETMQATLDMAKRYNFEYANFYFAMAYPGTELHELARKEGIPLPDTWAGYGQYSEDALPMATKHLSAADIVRFRDQAFIEYNTNPVYRNMMEKRFGPESVAFIDKILSHKIRRKILEKV